MAVVNLNKVVVLSKCQATKHCHTSVNWIPCNLLTFSDTCCVSGGYLPSVSVHFTKRLLFRFSFINVHILICFEINNHPELRIFRLYQHSCIHFYPFQYAFKANLYYRTTYIFMDLKKIVELHVFLWWIELYLVKRSPGVFLLLMLHTNICKYFFRRTSRTIVNSSLHTSGVAGSNPALLYTIIGLIKNNWLGLHYSWIV